MTLRTDTVEGESGGDDVIVRGVNTCKFWMDLNGTGTIALQDSYNIDSVTDNGTGDYTITITTDFADGSYAVAGMTGNGNGIVSVETTRASTKLAGSLRINTFSASNSQTDYDIVSVIAFGNQ
jgi:hypothetical protein